MVSLFRSNKKGMTLRPRVRRSTPLIDLGLAVILGAVTGVYIFTDSMQRWQVSEGEFMAAKNKKAIQDTQTSIERDETHQR
ncbi:hypothetical protein CCR75_005794 [Bremia lactucae]|uniref:Uncharacterized protein n=1 Tax=Bremia lactucae TaxID=4779 RepID=A0A976IBZ5_BRELC|nr:hypothetical protein CCR75_005794 [Bremia lactucae]